MNMADAVTGKIVVIGSINMDLVCRTPKMPRPGETILGSDLITIPGGKGANQAVAAAKLGGDVHMIARVGDDDFGQRLLNGLQQHSVNTLHVTVTEGVSSGCAMIMVDRHGENSIVVAPGANHHLTPKDIDAAEKTIRSASVVVMQLEIPLETVRHVIAMCQRYGIYTILDPAPAPPKSLPRPIFGVDLFTPNQSEAEQILGQIARSRSSRKKAVDPKQLGSALLEKGAKTVVLKMGGKGAMIVGRDEQIETVRPFKIKVVDTTAAGDAFTGALAVAHAQGLPLKQAVRFANAAGAICCQVFGAQPSLPFRKDVEALLAASHR
jgi:ribokinase